MVLEIEAAMQTGASEDIQRLVHKLKGSPATLYAEALHSVSSEMEAAISEMIGMKRRPNSLCFVRSSPGSKRLVTQPPRIDRRALRVVA